MINQRMKMDIKKFKSVAVAIETYKILKKLAALDDRSAGMQITHLVKREARKRKIDNIKNYVGIKNEK
jgi:hypothetical protein